MEQPKLERATRRRLLKRASVVVAGVAGASVAGAVVASPAQAANGDQVLVGGSFTGTGTTQLTKTSGDVDGAPLRLSNTEGPSLTLDPVTSINPDSVASPVGTIIMDQWGDLTTVAQPPGATTKRFNFLYSPAWAVMPVPVPAFRILDTRSAGGLAFVVPGSATIDGLFLVPRNSPTDPDLVVDFSSFLNEGYVAVQVIVSVLGANGDGWLTLWGDEDWPGVVTVNFLGARATGGYAQAELTGVYATSTETFGHLKLKLTNRAAVTIDVVGFIAPDPFALFSDSGLTAMSRSAAGAAAAESTQRRVPKVPQRNQ